MLRRELVALIVALLPILHARRRAVVDRVVGDRAVLVLDDRRRRVTAPLDRLPPDARNEGAVLRVRLDGDRVTAAAFDSTATRRRERTRRRRLDGLAEEP